VLHVFKVSKVVLMAVLGFATVACVSTYDADDPDVKTFLGAEYKTTLPQEFNYVLFSKYGTLDGSIRFTNTGTLVFNEDGLQYANNGNEVSIDYDDIVGIRRVVVPVRRMSPLQRDSWLSIRYKKDDAIKKVGFRGDLARADPWTGDRIYAILRDILAARKQAVE